MAVMDKPSEEPTSTGLLTTTQLTLGSPFMDQLPFCPLRGGAREECCAGTMGVARAQAYNLLYGNGPPV